MVAGEHDYPACAGDCNGSYNLTEIKAHYFPRAKDVQLHIHPGAGHALPLHYNATAHFDVMFKYLRDHGL